MLIRWKFDETEKLMRSLLTRLLAGVWIKKTGSSEKSGSKVHNTGFVSALFCLLFGLL